MPATVKAKAKASTSAGPKARASKPCAKGHGGNVPGRGAEAKKAPSKAEEVQQLKIEKLAKLFKECEQKGNLEEILADLRILALRGKPLKSGLVVSMADLEAAKEFNKPKPEPQPAEAAGAAAVDARYQEAQQKLASKAQVEASTPHGKGPKRGRATSREEEPKKKRGRRGSKEEKKEEPEEEIPPAPSPASGPREPSPPRVTVSMAGEYVRGEKMYTATVSIRIGVNSFERIRGKPNPSSAKVEAEVKQLQKMVDKKVAPAEFAKWAGVPVPESLKKLDEDGKPKPGKKQGGKRKPRDASKPPKPMKKKTGWTEVGASKKKKGEE